MREKEKIRFNYYTLKIPVEKLAQKFKRPIKNIEQILGINTEGLSAAEIRKMRTMYKQKIPARLICEQFNISATTLYNHLKEIKKHRPAKRILTPQEIHTLWQEYRKGMPVKYLARKYGLTIATVYKKIKPYRKKFSQEDKQQIIRKKKAGFTSAQLAREYGKNPRTIWRIVKECKTTPI